MNASPTRFCAAVPGCFNPAVAGLLAVCLLPVLASGQATSAGAPPAEDDIIVLSAFEVDASKDDRYRAGNSVSATGLNTPIKELPMTIQVVTAEFIKDLGATDFTEALAYSSGVSTSDFEASSGGGGADANRGGGSSEKSASSSAGGNRFANVIGIRGFNVPFQNRLGFRYGGVVITPDSNIALGGLLDSVNMDRMEVVKGPNSLLYGVGVISGIVNVIPKKPLSVQRQSFGITAGSEGLLRLTADVTGPILQGTEDGRHRLNYRIMGAHETRDDWTDFRNKDEKYGALQFDYWYNKKWNVFVEFQKSKTRYEGTGSPWTYDDLSNALIPDFRNQFDEQYNFAQDGNVPRLSKINFSGDVRGRLVSSYNEPAIADRLFQGGSLPDSYRITGPDTYQERKEDDFLLDISYLPSERFAFSTGVFYTEADEEELAVNARILNNREDRFNVRGTLPVNFSDIGTNEYAQYLWGVKNEASGPFVTNFNPAIVQGEDDLKVGRYWWSLRPQKTKSFQWRVKGTADFETPFLFGGEAKHTILAGYHLISDNVDFLDGSEGLNRAYIDRNHPYVTSGRISVADAAAGDALYFRSVDDFSVLRYTDQNLAMPGDAYRNQDITFHGAYLILQSKFFDEKLGFIGGIRYDQYNAETKELIRISPENQTIGVSNDVFVDNPFSQVYGETPAVKSFAEDITNWSKTFALNYQIAKPLTVYGLYSEGISPNTSLVDGNNQSIPAENTRSVEFGFKWEAWEGRLSGNVAAYEIKRENAIWQFSQAPAPSKWADSTRFPAGFNPSASVFNPNPVNGLLINYGVDQDFISNSLVALQGKNLVTRSVDEPGRNKAWFILDPVTRETTRLDSLLDVENHQAGSLQPFNRRNYWWLDYAQLDRKQSVTVHVEDPNGTIVSSGRTYSLQTIDINWREYIENAFARRDLSNDNIGQADPIRYSVTPQPTAINAPGNNPSASTSSAGSDTFVTFDDRARGVDLELIYSPTKNLQFIFNYAHTEREAQGAFNLVDWSSLSSGELYGTEYDEVYRILGRENAGITGSDTDGDGVSDQFIDIRGNEISLDNPARPSDFFGGIDGLSLFFNPEDEARFWTRFTFDEGPLKRLGFSVGVRYQGPARTSIPIGGNDLGSNLFQTPEAASRTQFDAGMYYSFKWLEADWRLSLNVYNLADDTEGLTTVAINDPNSGRTVVKRTRLLYAPRSYRFGLTVDF